MANYQSYCQKCSAGLSGVFSVYLPKLLAVEGGFQENPADQGNYNSLGVLVGTNYGISGRFYENVIGRPPTKPEMKALTKAEAIEIYRQYFWHANRMDEVKNQQVANTVIDQQINAGNGILMAQRILNQYFSKNISEDGGVGNETLSAINSVNPSSFVSIFNSAREDWYKTRHNSDEFADGWLTRLNEFTYKNSYWIAAANATMVLGLTYFLTKDYWNEL